MRLWIAGLGGGLGALVSIVVLHGQDYGAMAGVGGGIGSYLAWRYRRPV